VVALFGAYGVTGHYFLKLAMEAGYHVRALILPGIVLDDLQDNENLTLVTGTFDEDNKIRRVVRKAAYVVCMLNDCDNPLQKNPSTAPPSNFSFMQRLVPIMEKCSACRVLLYQVRFWKCLYLDLDSRPKTAISTHIHVLPRSSNISIYLYL
jgi:hypothetical protein